MYIVGLGGPTCTGKTTVAKSVAAKLGGKTISMESYYLDQSNVAMAERVERNYDSPDAIDVSLLSQHLRDFAAGNDIKVPVYDFAEHTRVAGRTDLVRNANLLIIEGILVLHWPQLRSLFNLCVYLDAPDDVCFQRRRVRDIVERQRSHEFIARQYKDRVQPMAVQYILPTRRYANLVIDANQGTDQIAAELMSRITASTQAAGR